MQQLQFRSNHNPTRAAHDTHRIGSVYLRVGFLSLEPHRSVHLQHRIDAGRPTVPFASNRNNLTSTQYGRKSERIRTEERSSSLASLGGRWYSCAGGGLSHLPPGLCPITPNPHTSSAPVSPATLFPGYAAKARIPSLYGQDDPGMVPRTARTVHLPPQRVSRVAKNDHK